MSDCDTVPSLKNSVLEENLVTQSDISVLPSSTYYVWQDRKMLCVFVFEAC